MVRVMIEQKYLIYFQLGKVWNEIKPIVDNIHGRDSSRPNSPTRTSPVGSPMTSSGGGIPM